MPQVWTPFGLVGMSNVADPLGLLPQAQPSYGARGTGGDGTTGPVRLGGHAARTGAPGDLASAEQAQAADTAAKVAIAVAVAPVAVLAAPVVLPGMAIASLFTPTTEQARVQGIQARKDSNESTKTRHRGGE